MYGLPRQPPPAYAYPAAQPWQQHLGYGGPQQGYAYQHETGAPSFQAPALYQQPLPHQHQQRYPQQQQQQPAYQQQQPAYNQRSYQEQPGPPSRDLATPNPRPPKRQRDSGSGNGRASSGSDHQQQQRARRQHGASPPPSAAPRRQPQQQPQSWQDVLQADMQRFAASVVPTQQEEQQRAAALAEFEALTRRVLAPESAHGTQVGILQFGSGRAGLALHASDLDVVITGLSEPTEPNGGYGPAGKQFVAGLLRRIQREAWRVARASGLQDSKLIAHARIPVLKLFHRGGIEMDVSFGNTSGIQAATFLQTMITEFQVLKPLVLVLKAVLKQQGLGDVSIGGVGSWSLANMAIAHLMEEDQVGGPVDHCGHMLVSFLQRFGRDWDINAHAVAVAEGGVVPRASLVAAGGGPFGARDKLCLKDPLTGREVAGGSHRYADVARLFGDLHRQLTADAAAGAAAASKQRIQFPMLGRVLDCEAMLQRAGGGSGQQPWQQQLYEDSSSRQQYGGTADHSRKRYR